MTTELLDKAKAMRDHYLAGYLPAKTKSGYLKLRELDLLIVQGVIEALWSAVPEGPDKDNLWRDYLNATGDLTALRIEIDVEREKLDK